jgi:hypothetical protein
MYNIFAISQLKKFTDHKMRKSIPLLGPENVVNMKQNILTRFASLSLPYLYIFLQYIINAKFEFRKYKTLIIYTRIFVK